MTVLLTVYRQIHPRPNFFIRNRFGLFSFPTNAMVLVLPSVHCESLLSITENLPSKWSGRKTGGLFLFSYLESGYGKPQQVLRAVRPVHLVDFCVVFIVVERFLKALHDNLAELNRKIMPEAD